MKKRLTVQERGLWWGERESKALPLLNPVNGKLDTKLRAMKGSQDLALMSKHRNVSGLQEVVIGSDLFTFLPITLEAGVSDSIWGQKMTPALGTLGSSILTNRALAGLGFLIHEWLTWEATMTESH